MTMKYGVIGAGNMGRNHIRLAKSMNNEFELVGVYDPDQAQIDNLGLRDIYCATPEELFEKCEAVSIVAPSSLHKELALKACAADTHALVEKPLALSEADATEICDAFERAGKTLMVGHVERFNPVVRELEKIVKEEKPFGIHIERCSSRDPRISDTDVVYDLMIHDVDILLHALAQEAEVKGLFAAGRRVYSEKFYDYVEASFRFADNTIASIVSSRATENKIRKIHLHCENAFIDADLLQRNITIYRRTTYDLDVGYDPTYRQENIIEKVLVSNEEPLRAELQHFHDCIESGETPKTGGRTAVDSLGILDRIKGQIY